MSETTNSTQANAVIEPIPMGLYEAGMDVLDILANEPSEGFTTNQGNYLERRIVEEVLDDDLRVIISQTKKIGGEIIDNFLVECISPETNKYVNCGKLHYKWGATEPTRQIYRAKENGREEQRLFNIEDIKRLRHILSVVKDHRAERGEGYYETV
jgi:hypothetical protein